jgi:uncharacterized caspase-like protein
MKNPTNVVSSTSVVSRALTKSARIAPADRAGLALEISAEALILFISGHGWLRANGSGAL